METTLIVFISIVWTAVIFSFGIKVGRDIAMIQAKEIMADTFGKVDNILKQYNLQLEVEKL